MKKTYLNIIGLFFLITFLGLQFAYNFDSLAKNYDSEKKLKTSPPPQVSLLMGVLYEPHSIDPHDAWDSSSFNVIDQVCEGLFTCNYSDPQNKIIPRLALDYGIWSNDGLNYTVPLRQDVIFHDRTPFNATAVKWNFDRLAYLMNITGTLPMSTLLSVINPVYRWLDGTPIINKTEEVDLYTIKFVLNKPFGGFEALLSFSGSYFVSPSSTPFSTYIEAPSGKLVGTGPFVYEGCNIYTNMTFHAFEEYWRTNSTMFLLALKIFPDTLTMVEGLINGEVDIIENPSPLYFDMIANTEHLRLIESQKGSWTLHYLGFNNHLINQTYRKAISYAVNYSHLIDHLKGGYVERLKSPIPGSMLYSNYSFNIPTYNVTKAREIMQSMGYGVGWEVTPGGLHEVNWTSTKFRTINFTFNMGNTYLEKVGQLLIDNLGKIGIEVEVYNESWADLLGKLFGMWGNTKDMLEMFYIGWMADYNDPSQFINFLFSNSSMYNTVQYNGGFGGFLLYNPENDVELLMEQAITSINRNERSQLYNKIQQLIIERDFPWIYGYTPKTYVAFHKDLEGIEENNFISVDEDGASSVKGDFQLLTWKYNPSFFPIYIISGYHFPYILLIAFISVIYFINYKRLKLRS